MRSGPEPLTVATPSASVTSAAMDRPVISVSTERSLGGGLPGEKLSPTAEGSVEWAQPSDVMDGPSATPWTRRDGFPLPPGQPVQVSVGTVETGLYRVLTAVVDSSQGNADGSVVSNIVDPVDRLHRAVSVPALRDFMPNHIDGNPTRLVGVMVDAVVTSVLRQCGIGNVPLAPSGFRGVSAPMQGTAWPERGEMVTASAKATVTSVPVTQTRRGIAIKNGVATYGASAATTIQQGLLVAATITGAETWSITVAFTGRAERVRVTGNGTRVAAQYAATGSSWVDVVTVPASGSWDRVGVDFTSGTVRLILTDDGAPMRNQAVSRSWPSGMATAQVSSVAVDTDAGLSGLQVGNGNTAAAYTSESLTMVRSGDLTGRVQATPAIVNQTALDVLIEIAQATCRVFWWDEDGVFHWDTARRLLEAPPVVTLTSRDDLLDLSWSESLADTHSRVNVDYKTPVMRGANEPIIDLWQARGETLEPGSSIDTIISVPDDEDWMIPHLGLRDVGLEGLLQFNRGRGSWYGGIVGSDPAQWAQADGTITATIQRITDQAFKLRVSWAGTVPVIQRTLPDDVTSSLAGSRRSFDLPILRGRGKTVWVHENAFYGNGPAAASEYIHPAGKWVGENPAPVGEFLAEWLTVPRPKARGIRVLHDPRLQVGDVVRVRDEHAHGIELVGLCTRVAQTTRAGSQDMQIDLYIISGTPTTTTLGEHTLAQGTTSLATHTTSMGTTTLGTHTGNPTH